MKRWLLLLTMLMLILTGCSYTQSNLPTKTIHLTMKQEPPLDFIPRDVTIVSIGDSLTQGVGSENNGGYIPFLKNELEQLKIVKNADFKNFGVKGNRTDQLLKRLKEPAVTSAIKDADIVIITIGGNDIMQVFKDNLLGLKFDKFIQAENKYRDRLREIIVQIKDYNDEASILLVGIYNPFIKWFSDIKEMNDIVRNWNEASVETISDFEKTTFVPVADLFENNEELLLYTDYFHPNLRGYELIAERIYSILVVNKTSGFYPLDGEGTG